jgi:hypothetical protein
VPIRVAPTPRTEHSTQQVAFNKALAASYRRLRDSNGSDQSLRHLLTLAGALLEVFGMVVVTSEAVEISVMRASRSSACAAASCRVCIEGRFRRAITKAPDDG